MRGSNLDVLSTDPGQQRRTLDTLSGSDTQERVLGACTFRTTSNPVLSDKGERRLSHLSRHMMVHPTTVTVVVDQLEARKLVKRAAERAKRKEERLKAIKEGREEE